MKSLERLNPRQHIVISAIKDEKLLVNGNNVEGIFNDNLDGKNILHLEHSIDAKLASIIEKYKKERNEIFESFYVIPDKKGGNKRPEHIPLMKVKTPTINVIINTHKPIISCGLIRICVSKMYPLTLWYKDETTGEYTLSREILTVVERDAENFERRYKNKRAYD